MFRMKGWLTKPLNSLSADRNKKPKPANLEKLLQWNEQIRDQVISKCSSYELHLKLLKKNGNMTLPQLREIAPSEKQTAKRQIKKGM